MCLVRGLVLGEANVAIDAEHRSLRVAADLGRERLQLLVHLADQVAHRLAHLTFVLRAMRLEPLLVVVLREPAKEAQRRRCERHGTKSFSRSTRSISGWAWSLGNVSRPPTRSARASARRNHPRRS